MKHGLVDIHQHLLYELDDGSKNPEDMYRMLDMAAEQGITRIIATPHVTPGVYWFDRSQYEKAFQMAVEYCEEKELNIELYEGAEILYTDQTCRFLQEGIVPTMGQTDFVLVEFSPDIQYGKLCEALGRLLANGYRPILAHVERYDCLTVLHRAERLKREMDVYFQVNCSTIIKCRSLRIRLFIKRMLKKQMIDAVASDAHDTSVRPNQMKTAWMKLRKQCSKAYARRLVNGSIFKEE